MTTDARFFVELTASSSPRRRPRALLARPSTVACTTAPPATPVSDQHRRDTHLSQTRPPPQDSEPRQRAFLLQPARDYPQPNPPLALSATSSPSPPPLSAEIHPQPPRPRPAASSLPAPTHLTTAAARAPNAVPVATTVASSTSSCRLELVAEPPCPWSPTMNFLSRRHPTTPASTPTQTRRLVAPHTSPHAEIRCTPCASSFSAARARRASISRRALPRDRS